MHAFILTSAYFQRDLLGWSVFMGTPAALRCWSIFSIPVLVSQGRGPAALQWQPPPEQPRIFPVL